MGPMNRFVKWTGITVAILGLLVFCYWVVADYGYSAVSGTYILRTNGETSTLLLRKDRSYEQELVHDGKTNHARGNWYRFGEGGIAFSKEFLKMPGQEAKADGEVYGNVRKAYGLFFSIVFNPDPGGPVFHKKLLS
jgi:hypothetical protein